MLVLHHSLTYVPVGEHYWSLLWTFPALGEDSSPAAHHSFQPLSENDWSVDKETEYEQMK